MRRSPDEDCRVFRGFPLDTVGGVRPGNRDRQLRALDSALLVRVCHRANANLPRP